MNCDNNRMSDLPGRSGEAAKAERFGVSTHLFHEHRLTRDHLVHIAAHGFEALELFATRAHFDYHDDHAREQLAEWLSDTRLELHSVHAPAFHAAGTGGDFDTVADTRDGLVLREEIASDAKEILIFPDVLRGASAAEKDARVFLFLDVLESDLRLDRVALPFLGDGPARLHLVHHHLVAAFFGRSDHRLVATLDQTVVGVEGIDRFGGVADDDEHFGFHGRGLTGNPGGKAKQKATRPPPLSLPRRPALRHRVSAQDTLGPGSPRRSLLPHRLARSGSRAGTDA